MVKDLHRKGESPRLSMKMCKYEKLLIKSLDTSYRGKTPVRTNNIEIKIIWAT